VTVQTPDAATIASVALTDLGSDTHRQDFDQRYIPLSFSQTSGGLSVQPPGNADIAPPGYYMLWLVNSSGVPSMAQMIQVNGTSSSDTQPPTVSITAPAAGSTVSGTVAVTANATDNVGVSSVQFTLDGANLGAPITSAPYTMNWDSTTVADGTHTLSAKASDAAGNTSTAAAVSVTVSNATTPPTISSVLASNVTVSGATITWTTSKPATSQVEYGTSTAYGSTTTLDSTLVALHSQSLTGLSASTTYDYAVISKDSYGNQAVSGNMTFTTSAAAPTLLVGDQKTEATSDSNSAGSAEAFQYTATTTGTANTLYVFLSSSNTASQAVVGLYTDNGSSKPATLLAQGTINPTKSNAWNSIAIAPVSVTAGVKYWIALLGPSGGGIVQFRDVSGGGPSVMSSQTSLATLPPSWSSGASYTDSPLSAYAAGTTVVDTQPPIVSISAPAAGSTVTGSVSVTASATDNIGVASVQFTLDGKALGSPVTAAPYSVTWDSTTALNSTHTLGATATDTSGNVASASTVSVVVSNPLPVISGVNATSITSSGATIVWTTDKLSTSQVEYGLTNSYGSATTLNSTLVTSHSVTISGLGASTTYHYRVDSKDAGGNLVSSIDFTFTTAAPAPPVITNQAAGSITSVGAVITWTTDQPSTSQVNYGTSTALGSSTTLDSTLVTSHSQSLSGLSPNTTYYCQVVSKNATGQQTVSSTFSFMTAAAGPVVLVGDAKVEGNADDDPGGSAEAFQYTAGTSGTATKLSVYVSSTNAATSVIVGLYTNTSGDDPGALLASGTITAPVKGGWNTVTIPSTNLTSGTKYWIAVLSPSGAGTIQFRDVGSGGLTEMNSKTNLTALPATWSPGAMYANSPMSAYASP
jgi:Big-like domain-containing protein/galactose oxidase-like protein/purple acid phosphatase-like protein